LTLTQSAQVDAFQSKRKGNYNQRKGKTNSEVSLGTSSQQTLFTSPVKRLPMLLLTTTYSSAAKKWFTLQPLNTFDGVSELSLTIYEIYSKNCIFAFRLV